MEKFILKGLSELNEGFVLDGQVQFEEVVNFDLEKLQCFRRNIDLSL